uniref:IMD domain-containing protein n=1 Tax=Ditylenchus dipsaci TaxID=166011 RepID=A0A915DD39_9BILA
MRSNKEAKCPEIFTGSVKQPQEFVNVLKQMFMKAERFFSGLFQMNSASNTSSAGADILISNLFQTMVHDLKSSSSAWDNVCQKATKLSSQLLSTVHCLSNFVDAVQVISDNANNIKGASRDIGAALTRFCLRQKSLENLIRSLATALTDQFVVCLEKKSVEWKQRVGEIERRRMRSLKSRSRQQHKKGLTS